MAVAPVEKFKLIAHSGVKAELLHSLQEEGLVQIEKAGSEEIGFRSPVPDVSDLEHILHRIAHVLDHLARWEKKSLAERLQGRKPVVSRKERNKVLEFDYRSVVEEFELLERQKIDIQTQVRFLEKETEFLEPLSGLSVPVEDVRSTSATEVILGVIPTAQFPDFLQAVEEEALWCHIVDRGKRAAHVLLVYLKKDGAKWEQVLRDSDIRPLYFTAPILKRAKKGDRVTDVMARIGAEIAAEQDKIKALDREIQAFNVHFVNLKQVHDVLVNEREKRLSSRLLGETESIFFLEGWVCSSDVKKLKTKLKPFSDSTESYFRPPLAEEDPPVILRNPKIWRPFEIITKLYGMPLPGTVDPTLLLAPFFFLFVGLTVSEGGYGLLVGLLCLLFIRFAKPRGGLLQFLKLMAILSVSTVILGTLVGGWFGFPIRRLMVLDPLKNPVAFLLLSLVLGFIQVWFGTLINMVAKIRNKEYLQGFFVQGGWLLLLPSLVLYGLRKTPVFGILALAGAAGIVFFAAPKRNPIARFFGGLYSLYDISRYVADILSYSRLLALGLATSVIAMVVNTLCQTALSIPWIGWLVAALIFIGGHLFNLGISFLGGFVHSMRLQFVEFFSKFFQSGGKPFKAFELESKYVDFV